MPTDSPREPFTPNTRRVLEAMSDGNRHWAQELYETLGLPRRNSAMYALNWLARRRYVKSPKGNDYVIIGPDRTDYVYVLTNKGRKAANDLDAGYDLLEHLRLPER